MLTIILLLVLLLALIAILLLRHPFNNMSGAHASVVKPFVPTYRNVGDKLIINFGRIAGTACDVTNAHHFPVIYGTNRKQYVHGVPVDTTISYTDSSKGPYSMVGAVYTFKERRVVFETTISLYTDNNLLPQNVCIVMKHDYDLLKMPPTHDYIDFAYSVRPKNDNVVGSMYKYNSTPRGALNVQDTFETVKNQLGTDVNIFIFGQDDKHVIEDMYTDEKNKIPYGTKYMVVKKGNDWVIKVEKNASNADVNKLIDAFKEALVMNNFYDYLDGNGTKYANLHYTKNDINTAYDVLRYFSNVPPEYLHNPSTPEADSELMDALFRT